MPAPRILLVDDEPSVAQVLAAWLRRAGYVVIVAGSGHEAEHFLDEPFDALVLDLRLPGMRGDAFYYLAITRQPWLTRRALFVSGDHSEQAEEIIGSTGCPFLQKPFPLREMLNAVLAIAPLHARGIPRVG